MTALDSAFWISTIIAGGGGITAIIYKIIKEVIKYLKKNSKFVKEGLKTIAELIAEEEEEEKKEEKLLECDKKEE